MGKKRRAINRARKFATKYFKFLDKLDGNAADGAIEEYDAYIDTLTVTDNNNQTVTLTGRVLGNVEGLDNNANNRKVQYSFDGGSSWSDSPKITDDSGVDTDRFIFTVAEGKLNNGNALISGSSYTCTVRPKGITDTQRDLASSEFTVRENKINLQASAFSVLDDSNQNQIRFTKANLFAATPGKKASGSAGDAALGNNGIRILVNKDGGANNVFLLNHAFTGSSTTAGTINTGDYPGGGANYDTVLATAATGVYAFTVIPLENGTNRELRDSAISFSLTIE